MGWKRSERLLRFVALASGEDQCLTNGERLIPPHLVATVKCKKLIMALQTSRFLSAILQRNNWGKKRPKLQSCGENRSPYSTQVNRRETPTSRSSHFPVRQSSAVCELHPPRVRHLLPRVACWWRPLSSWASCLGMSFASKPSTRAMSAVTCWRLARSSRRRADAMPSEPTRNTARIWSSSSDHTQSVNKQPRAGSDSGSVHARLSLSLSMGASVHTILDPKPIRRAH